MTWLAAITTGIGVGIVFYGGLWLTVRWLCATGGRRWPVRQQQPIDGCYCPGATGSLSASEQSGGCITGGQAASCTQTEARQQKMGGLVALSGALRLVIAGLTFFALARESIELPALALLGFWQVRGWFFRELGGWPAA